MTDSHLYFAYGNNMSLATMDSLGETYEVLGPACLQDYRLSFTRHSVTWNAGVADVVRKRGFRVWGVLYRVSGSALEKIHVKEGAHRSPPAYVQKRVSVDLHETRQVGGGAHQVRVTAHEAVTYEVLDKHRDDSGLIDELPPAPAYIRSLIDGACEHNIDAYYVSFLRSIERQPAADFRNGYLAVPTGERTEARGMPIVRVNSRKPGGNDHLCVVEHCGNAALAVMVHDPDVDEETCELDQAIRHCLGILGRFAFGAHVRLVDTDMRAYRPFRVNTRALSLPVLRPSVLDAEKNIVTMHPKNIALMGLAEGDYVEILAPQRTASGGYAIRTLVRRVYAGSQAHLHKVNNEEVPYPDQVSLYVDLDGRKAMGLDIDAFGVGALVRPSTRKLLAANFIRYGITLGVGVLALFPVIQALKEPLGFGDVTAAVATLLLACALTVLSAIVDLRSRFRY